MKTNVRTKRIYVAVGVTGLWLAVFAARGLAANPAGCTILGNDNQPFTGRNGDPLFKILNSQKENCPGNVFDLRALLQRIGLTLQPAFVGNRGFDNPLPFGSFSFFEGVIGTFEGEKLTFGDFLFGHFTEATGEEKPTTLSAQQQPGKGSLMIELIVWDSSKGYYNFYEMLGTGKTGAWFYRGDSMDIAKDLTNLHRKTDSNEPVFGRTLRCSGCHMNGGPIMKELSFPHNSWWRKDHKLPLGGLRIATNLQPIVDKLVDAGDFSQWIKAGVDKLQASQKYQDARSKLTWHEQLRPLFCEVEVNIASGIQPFTQAGDQVHVPVGFFVDPRLVPEGTPEITIPKGLYTHVLEQFGSSFLDKDTGPRPTDPKDADYPWLTPVKAYSDIQAIESLVKQGFIDQEFVVAVLAVDMTRPMLFNSRCALLQLVPQQRTPDWKQELIKNLKQSKLPAAQELLKNLTDAKRTIAFHQKQAADLLAKVQQRVSKQDYVTSLFQLLIQRRDEVFESVLSKDPRGQIFEPGFRVIFPTMLKIETPVKPGQFRLTPDGNVERSAPNP